MSKGSKLVRDSAVCIPDDDSDKAPADVDSVEGRIRTFVDWPIALNQDPRQMSEAGFYYTGTGDEVRCFRCDVRLKEWLDDHVVWQRHAATKPDCPYVLEKGPAGDK